MAVNMKYIWDGAEHEILPFIIDLRLMKSNDNITLVMGSVQIILKSIKSY